MSRPSAKMVYKRYGECPPWYSIGKTSSMEIQAYRYDSLADIPSDVLQRLLGFQNEVKKSSNSKSKRRFSSREAFSDESKGT